MYRFVNMQVKTLLAHTNLKKLSQDIKIWYQIITLKCTQKLITKNTNNKYKIKTSYSHSNTFYETDM